MNEKVLKEVLVELKRIVAGTIIRAPLVDAIIKLESTLIPAPRFYKGQPVLVKSVNGGWHKKIYSHRSNEGVHVCTTYEGASPLEWREVQPDTTAVSLPNWVEHDGSAGRLKVPKEHRIVWVDAAAHVIITETLRLDSNVIRYCIIPLPEFINNKGEL